MGIVCSRSSNGDLACGTGNVVTGDERLIRDVLPLVVSGISLFDSLSKKTSGPLCRLSKYSINSVQPHHPQFSKQILYRHITGHMRHLS